MVKKKVWPTLYKYTSKGQIQQWTIAVDDDKYSTEEGIKDGKLTPSLPTVCYSKNIGKTNETTPHEQALLEAAAKYKKKIESGYNEVLTKGDKFFKPMLAEDAKKVTLDFKKYSYYIQPKLDGLRAINEDNTLMSRNGKPYLSCPHLYQKGTTLDGELYNHEYKDDFNKIVSLCKKQNPSKEELKESKEKVQFWVYDYPGHDGIFSARYEALQQWFVTEQAKAEKNEKPFPFVLVPTYPLKSQKELEKYHEKFLEMGYEGSIIRVDSNVYENKRSKQLLKYKDFVDEEFEIIGYEEGTGGRTGTIGKFIMKHDKNPKETFESNVKGDFEYLRTVWKNKERYIGKKATVKYFNRTPKKEDGSGDKPRFPYIIKVDREEYE